jgi:apolipoprotein D and lipocalin family protein
MVRSLAIAFLASSTALVPATSSLKTVDHVDLQRYAGKWYELARIPNRFEKKCDRNVTAEYILEGKTITVRNTCLKADGETSVAKGRAKIIDKTTGARLKVTFFWPFYGDYWIIGLDPEYRWAIVGTPNRKYLWILSRTPSLPQPEMNRILIIVEEHGYRRSALTLTRQISNDTSMP